MPRRYADALKNARQRMPKRAPSKVNVQKARAAGFEPAISGLEPDAFTRLSYAPIWDLRAASIRVLRGHDPTLFH